MGPERKPEVPEGGAARKDEPAGAGREGWSSEDEREEEGYGQPESSAQKLPQPPDDESP